MTSLAKRALLVVAVAGVMVGARFLLGSAVGAPCTDAFLCNALPARCVLGAAGSDGYCSRPCIDASACEPGWSCVPIERRDERGAVLEVEAVCLRPGDAPSTRHTLRRR